MCAATPSATLTPAEFQVLVSVASGHAHGYAVMRFIEDVTDGAVQLKPGTLYRTIARLVGEGLVEEADGSDPDAPHDARRRYYALTDSGRQAAACEAELLARMADAAAAAGLLTDRPARTEGSDP